MNALKKIIISGGGTGGHIFPAIAIANEIKSKYPDAEILFVGALGKMEMEKVPAAGYTIVGLPIAGFQRKSLFKNVSLPFKLLKSLFLAKSILKKFKPQVVIGVGGYASGPLLQIATSQKIPSLIQEQNSFAGKTNKILSQKVNLICTAYEGLEKVFPPEKIKITGNPVRADFNKVLPIKNEAILDFKGLVNDKKTIFVMGGSLGSKTLNDSVFDFLHQLDDTTQVLWQCGKFYKNELNEKLKDKNYPVHLTDFISNMANAYACADVIISRAGALSISELCLIGKPTILVPSPNVAEDHQTKNAQALVSNNAALLIKDSEARNSVMKTAVDLLSNAEKSQVLSQNIKKMGKPNATKEIVSWIETIAR